MNDFISYIILLGALGTNGDMPFWATANQYGIMPESSGGLVAACAFQDYHKDKAFQYHWGISLAGRSDRSDIFQVIPDQVYAGIKWKPLSLDLGIWHRKKEYMASDPLLGSISSSSGNVIWSGNGRSMPGYSINLDHWGIPGTRHIVELSGAWGDYKTIDTRYVRGSWMHDLQLYLTFNVWRFSFTAGIEQWAEWAGVHPVYGPLPSSFKDYCRICIGNAAGSGAPQTDQAGSLGDLRGRGQLRLDYRQDGWGISLQHDMLYDDRSFFWFENWQDGVNTLCFSFDDKDRWVTDIAYEFIYTMWQSGPLHDRPATPEEIRKYGNNYPVVNGRYIIGGADNYFNNGEYRSGWTLYGRTAGLPLITPVGTGNGTWSRNGVTMGVENNRIRAHNFGISGKLFRTVPYKLMLTWSENFGLYYNNGYAGAPSVEWPGIGRFSAGLSAIAKLPGERLQLLPSVYMDCGRYVRNSFAATLGLRYIFANCPPGRTKRD